MWRAVAFCCAAPASAGVAFSSATTLPTGLAPSEIVTADFNNDGIPDPQPFRAPLETGR